MLTALPQTVQDILDWEWGQFDPFYKELADYDLTADNIKEWLTGWSKLNNLLDEHYCRLYVATSVDTTDEAAEERYENFMANIYPHLRQAENALNQKLLASDLEPAGFDLALRNIRTEADLFREANLPLFTEESKLGTLYDKINGAQTVDWEGEERTIKQLDPLLRDVDRGVRERAWRLASQRQLADRDALNDLWKQFMDLRGQVAANADMEDYRAYKWREMLRFGYTPADCESFQQAIEKVVVPAAARRYEKRRQRLGIDSVRPWDVFVDTSGQPALQPFTDVADLKSGVGTIFQQVDPQLGDYFQIMRDENLLDLDNRKGKAPGGYCVTFAHVKRPFIFMNAVGLHDDVQTMLHEGGHAFHAFESSSQPYHQQSTAPMEFCEVASMSMELMGAPYLAAEKGGFYNEAEAARARIEHLESLLTFWPYMAVVDAFQHWVYTHHQAATDPANCDAKWGELWDRFMVGIDWQGLEDEKITGWHRKLHIFQVPFYYVEYGLAQLGAVQVWANSLKDPVQATQAYRKALALGGTVTLPELFQAAGAKFAFDSGTMTEAVTLVEETIAQLEAAL